MSTNKFQYWPSESQLGSTKFTMPTNAEDWPEGEALVGNFVYDKGYLVDVVDTKALITNESKSTTFPYDYVNIQVDKSLEDVMTFNQGERTKYCTINYTSSTNVNNVTKIIDNILYDIDNNEIGVLDTSKIVNGDNIFDDYSNLNHFQSDLSSLVSGINMFLGCKISTGHFIYNIANKLTEFTDGSIHELSVTLNVGEWCAGEDLLGPSPITKISAPPAVLPPSIGGPLYGLTIPYYKSGESLKCTYRGWIIHLTSTCETGTIIGSYSD